MNKNCIRCNCTLKSMFEDWQTLQPESGAEIRIIPSYGSKYDNIPEHRYYGVICDSCIEVLLLDNRIENK